MDFSEKIRQKVVRKYFLTDSFIGQKFRWSVILTDNESVKKIVEIMLTRCRFVKNYRQEYFDEPVKNSISTKLFLTDHFSVKLTVKNLPIFRQTPNSSSDTMKNYRATGKKDGCEFMLLSSEQPWKPWLIYKRNKPKRKLALNLSLASKNPN